MSHKWQKVTKFRARRIDVKFDQYFHSTNKDKQFSQHEAPQIDYIISGPIEIKNKI